MGNGRSTPRRGRTRPRRSPGRWSSRSKPPPPGPPRRNTPRAATGRPEQDNHGRASPQAVAAQSARHRRRSPPWSGIGSIPAGSRQADQASTRWSSTSSTDVSSGPSSSDGANPLTSRHVVTLAVIGHEPTPTPTPIGVGTAGSRWTTRRARGAQLAVQGCFLADDGSEPTTWSTNPSRKRSCYCTCKELSFQRVVGEHLTERTMSPRSMSQTVGTDRQRDVTLSLLAQYRPAAASYTLLAELLDLKMPKPTWPARWRFKRYDNAVSIFGGADPRVGGSRRGPGTDADVRRGSGRRPSVGPVQHAVPASSIDQAGRQDAGPTRASSPSSATRCRSRTRK